MTNQLTDDFLQIVNKSRLTQFEGVMSQRNCCKRKQPKRDYKIICYWLSLQIQSVFINQHKVNDGWGTVKFWIKLLEIHINCERESKQHMDRKI